MFVQVATQDAVVWDGGRMGGEASAPRKIGIAGAVSAIAIASAMTAAGLFRKMRCAFPFSYALAMPDLRRAYVSWRSRGSSLSRSQSPMKLSAMTVKNMARPGKNEIHHASRR